MKLRLLGALALAGALSGCVTIAEHKAFVKAASDYRDAVSVVVSEHHFLTSQAQHNWLATDSEFAAAIKAAQK